MIYKSSKGRDSCVICCRGGTSDQRSGDDNTAEEGRSATRLQKKDGEGAYVFGRG